MMPLVLGRQVLQSINKIVNSCSSPFCTYTAHELNRTKSYPSYPQCFPNPTHRKFFAKRNREIYRKKVSFQTIKTRVQNDTDHSGCPLKAETYRWRDEIECKYPDLFEQAVCYVRRQFEPLASSADEIVSTAFVTFLKNDEEGKTPKFQDWEHFKNHILKIVKHIALNEVRKLLKQNLKLITDLTPEDACSIETMDRFFYEAGLSGESLQEPLQEAQLAIMTKLIDELPNTKGRPYRNVAQLLLRGMSHVVISKTLSAPLGTAGRWVFELKKHLRLSVAKVNSYRNY